MKITKFLTVLVLCMAVFSTVSAATTQIPKLNMELTVPDGYTNFDTGLEKGEYAYFVSNDSNQYISVKATTNDDIKEIKTFDNYADSELKQIASKISDETRNSDVSVFKAGENRFIKISTEGKQIYYIVNNGVCISIAAVKADNSAVEDISSVIKSIKFGNVTISDISFDDTLPMPIWLIGIFAFILFAGIVIFNIVSEEREQREKEEDY